MQNRSPQISHLVLDAFLQTYKVYRTEHTTITGDIKSGLDKGAARARGVDPKSAQQNQLINHIETSIRRAKNFTQRFELIFTLRESAHKAFEIKQTYTSALPEFITKYFFKSRSLECYLFHAMACCIINDLKDTNEFQLELKRLIDELKDIDLAIIEAPNKDIGIDIVKLTKDRNDLVLRLAYLNSQPHITKAIELNILPAELKCPTGEPDLQDYNCANEAILAAPLPLQNAFDAWMFQTEFNPKIHIDYARFKELAMNGKGYLPASFTHKPEVDLRLAANNQMLFKPAPAPDTAPVTPKHEDQNTLLTELVEPQTESQSESQTNSENEEAKSPNPSPRM